MPPPIIGFSPGISIVNNMGFTMKRTKKRTQRQHKMKSAIGIRKSGGKRRKRTSRRRRRRRNKRVVGNIPPLMDV